MNLLFPVKNKNGRVHFALEWQIILFIVVILLLLVLLFPKNQLLRDVVEVDEPQAVTLMYLQNLLIRNPNSYPLTVAMIQQEIGLEKLNQAEQDLNALRAKQAVSELGGNWDIRWLQYLMMRAKVYQLPRDVPQRTTDMQHLALVMQGLAAAPLSAKRLQHLATNALEIGQPVIALSVYQRLLAMNVLQDPAMLANVGKIGLMVSNYHASAQFYFLAMDKEPNLTVKRNYAMQGLQALQAGNLLNEAMAVAVKLPYQVTNDKNILVYLTKLSLASNNPALAQKYIKRALLLLAEGQ